MQAVPQEPLTFCTGGSRSEGRGGQEEEARGRAFPWAPLPDSSYGGLFGAGGQHKTAQAWTYSPRSPGGREVGPGPGLGQGWESHALGWVNLCASPPCL